METAFYPRSLPYLQEDFPAEPRLNIFGYLSQSELLTAQQVCRLWANLAISESLWKELYMQESGTIEATTSEETPRGQHWISRSGF